MLTEKTNQTKFNNKLYRQCSISVMDNILDPDIVFDDNGICNYYYDFKKEYEYNVYTG